MQISTPNVGINGSRNRKNNSNTAGGKRGSKTAAMVPHTWPLRAQGQLGGKKTQVSGVEIPASLTPAGNPGEAVSAAAGYRG